MRTIKKLTVVVFLAALTLTMVGWLPSSKKRTIDSEEKVIVVLKFKTQKDKGEYSVNQFVKLIDKVKEEPNFISIKLHVDPKDETNIMLYEEWKDASYYNNEHMNTDHLKEFMANSVNFLTGPPEVTFWEVKHTF
ncbi:putative quinol monooxygenase [Winogradskyella aquimaris]|uniref:Quinol monooxygenase n=1 Tax=Winogradskyella aquimaris TaxID=864074 RepID=A0ABU5EQU2_9FLAO|nr:putative quinol monooxygenase [Winogradskyella aquimaris]MDY2587144.1 putative quinol monooxygenase [Winogradskyella aquimaris]